MNRESNSGKALAALLSAQMNTSGLTVGHLAKRLGISPGYMSQLLAGDKSFAAVSEEVLRSAAAVLNVPPVICFLLAGRLRHDDFVETEVSLVSELRKAMREVAASPFGMEVAVTDRQLVALPHAVQHLVALLYAEATDHSFVYLEKRWPWTIQGAARLARR